MTSVVRMTVNLLDWLDLDGYAKLRLCLRVARWAGRVSVLD